MSRRERLAGFKYQVGSIVAEVRKACRDELKILYSGGPFGDATWDRLRTLGESNVFEASKLNPKMKDLVRIKAPGFRVEGARDGELVVAFFEPGHRTRSRKRVEALLRGD
jgi:hypothetical protein